jgi:putative endonuclease
VGITNNLQRRLTEHRSQSSSAGRILKDFDLVHTEEYPNYPKARVREKFLKSGKGREHIKDLLVTRSASSGG